MKGVEVRDQNFKFVSASVVVAFILSLLFLTPLSANIKQVKAYKEAFPGEKPKCACCHTSEKPKKEDGQHDLNAYGKKVVEINKEADVVAYKKAGSNNCSKE